VHWWPSWICRNTFSQINGGHLGFYNESLKLVPSDETNTLAFMKTGGWMVDSGLAAILDFDKMAQNLHSRRFFIHREVGSIRNSYKNCGWKYQETIYSNYIQWPAAILNFAEINKSKFKLWSGFSFTNFF